ncbi:hypothetical protein ACTZWW_19105, partial [Salinarimonas sp. NSM]|uniref:hypothetical protein n=1 Tax=Salinarimonas sp. NSM TaxID=3458003 RepID=UPI00403704C0
APSVAQFPPPAPRPGSPAALADGLLPAEPETPGETPPVPTSPAVREGVRERFETPVSFFVRERPLDAVFRDLAEIAGLRMRINDRLEEEIVSAVRLDGTAREVLDRLTRRYNLVWFAERDLVDVARADTATVRTFRIDGVTDAEIRDAIARFGLVNVDFALEVDERNGIARIFAPPRLASRLESIIVGLRADTPEPLGPIEVIRFGLRDRAPS